MNRTSSFLDHKLAKLIIFALCNNFSHTNYLKHDPLSSTECAPGDAGNGNYIMYPRPVQGDKPNNYKFSSCSKTQILKVMQSKDCLEGRLSIIDVSIILW